MTWKEFKELMEIQGITDDMKIEYMDFNSFDCDVVGLYAYIDKETNEFSVH